MNKIKLLSIVVVLLWIPINGWTQPSLPPPDDTAYNATTWDGSMLAPTQNAVRDKIEAMGGGDVTGVGDCASGACLDGTSDGGTYIKLYDAQGATTITVGDNSGAVALSLPTTTGTLALTDAELTAIAALTFADVSIIQLTGAGAAAVLTCSAANQLIGVNAANNAFECKDTLNITTLNLPSSDADPATTAGQIRHDSSSTEADTAARGVVKYFDGTGVRTLIDTGTNYFVITKTEFLPIGWAVDGATAPAALAAVTGKEVNARAFTEADDVVFWWIVPNDYVGGVKYRVFYALSANANADDTAVFSMAGGLVANSGDPDGSAGTALTVTDELTTDDDQYQLMISDYSAESNADWSLAAGGVARLNFSHAAASDMVGAGEPLVIGIEIKYKAKIIGFAGY